MTPTTADGGTEREIPREELGVDPWAEMDEDNEYDELRVSGSDAPWAR